MPWKESSVVSEKSKFLEQFLTEDLPFTELCAQFGISRKTGYKWVGRYDECGRGGLMDQSRRPLVSANAISEDALIQTIVTKQNLIDPGQPSQNGRHERMHRDLKAEVQPLLVDLAQSQAALDVWRKEFNEERPHEALGMKTPAQVYTPSPRKHEIFDELQYPEGFLPRKVCSGGKIKLAGARIHISTVFAGYHNGLKPMDDKTMAVWFGEFHIGTIDLMTVSFSTADAKI